MTAPHGSAPAAGSTEESRGRSQKVRYAELQVTTNFSFLRGASHGEELVAQAKALGLEAIAIADRNTLAGVVRAHVAAKEAGLRLVIGARLDLEDAPSLLCFPTDRKAYGRLSRLISLGQGRAEKGKCSLFLADVTAHAKGQIFVALETCHPGRAPLREPGPRGKKLDTNSGSRLFASTLRAAAPAGMTDGEGATNIETCHPGRAPLREPRPTRTSFETSLLRIKSALQPAPLYLAASHTYRGDDRARIAALAAIAERCGTPLVAIDWRSLIWCEVLYRPFLRG